jgi:hypothetical protein
MGNFCNQPAKGLISEATSYEPYADAMPKQLGRESVDGSDGMKAKRHMESPNCQKASPHLEAGPQMSMMRSCMTVDQLESLTEERLSEWRDMPDCLAVDVDSDDSDELDFSKDRELHPKRPPAICSDEDMFADKRLTIASPARMSDLHVDEQTLRVFLPCAKEPKPSLYLGNSPGHGGAALVSSPHKVPILQRSNSSYLMAKKVPVRAKRNSRCDSSFVITHKPQRCDSSFIVTKKLSKKPQRCDSSYVATLQHCQSFLNTAGSCKAPPSHLSVSDLVEEICLDSLASGVPSVQELLAKLRPKLDVSESARIEKQCSGGQNKGTWVLRDGVRTLVLKLVEGQRKHPAVPTEAEVFGTLFREHPQMRSDSSLAFPLKVFHFRDAQAVRRCDLIVMKKAPGLPLAELISTKMSYQQVGQLMQIFEALGRFLAGVHNRYNLQHGDFQPSNIFYDETSGNFTLIDVGGMYGKLLKTDVEHFSESLSMLAKGLNTPSLSTEGMRRLKTGYATGKGRGF